MKLEPRKTKLDMDEYAIVLQITIEYAEGKVAYCNCDQRICTCKLLCNKTFKAHKSNEK